MRELKLRDIIILVISLVIIIVTIKVATAQVSGPKPQRGEWLCWATNSKTECGTYGWHKRKSIAMEAAMNLCEKQCGVGCAEDYCEVLK